jgi:hypothetical protein
MKEIPLLEAGDSRTMLSASVANELISALNAFIKMQGRNGIEVKIADGGVVIDFTGATSEGAPPPTIGDSSFRWRGEWLPSNSYQVGDIVIRSDEISIQDGRLAGTYLCRLDAPEFSPGPGEEGGSLIWETFATGWWDKLVFRYEQMAITIMAKGKLDLPQILIQTNRDTQQGGEIDIAIADTMGKKIGFKRYNYCINGVRHQIIALGCDPFPPID